MIEAPALKHTGGVYRLAFPGLDLHVTADRIHESGRDTSAELVIESRRPEYRWQPQLHQARLNLTSTRTKKSMAKDLAERYALAADGEGSAGQTAENNWFDVLEYVSAKVLKAYREGEPVRALADWQATDALKHRLNPFAEERQSSLLFGEGDSGKSWLGLLFGYLVATGQSKLDLEAEPGNVLYLDYETDYETTAERLKMLANGFISAPPENFHYRKMYQTVAADFQGLGRIVADKDIDLLIVDSAAPATGEPEASQATTEYFRALRGLGIANLTIAHMSKTGQDSHPFGSIFWRNLPRANFRAFADRTGDELIIGVKQTKANNGRRMADRAYSLQFVGDTVFCQIALPGDVPDLADRASVPDKILAALKSGALSTPDIAKDIGADVTAVRLACNRLKDRGALVSLERGIWGLPASVS